MNVALAIALAFVSLRAIATAVVAIVVAGTSRRRLPRSVSRRIPLAAGLGVAFFAGYILLPSWAELVPTRHVHWLPYLGLAASVIGPLGFARGVWIVERCLAQLLLAIVAASLLVPNWASLEPVRLWHVVFLSVYLFFLAALLPLIVDHVSNAIYVGVLVTVAISLPVLFLNFSFQYGEMALVAATALAGVGLVSFRTGSSMFLRGLAPVFAILFGGLAYVGYIEPEPRLSGFLVLPAAPFGLAVVRVFRLPRDGLLAIILPLISAGIVLGIGVAMVMMNS